MIKKRTNLILAAAFLGFCSIFISCSSSQQAVQPSLSQNSIAPGKLNKLRTHGPDGCIGISVRDIDPSIAAIDPAAGKSLQSKYASLLRVMPEAVRNLSLYHFIDEWYGVRYRLGGNSKAGIDCSAFVQRAYEQVFGINLLRTAFDQFGMSNLVWHKDQCKEGDLVFFKTHGSKISHVGIFLLNNFFVHASSSQGIMISNLDEKYWQKNFACAGRLM